MSWRQLAPAEGRTDDLLRLCADASFLVEPYLVWHQLCGFRWTQLGQRHWLPFLLETTVGAKRLENRIEALGLGCFNEVISIPAVYKRRLAPSKKPSRFLTACVAADKVTAIARMPEVLRMQLGLARVGDVDVRDPPQYESLKRQNVLPGFSKSEYLLRPGRYDTKRPVLGVIDDGCNFAHPAYLAGKYSRVVRLWDQSAEAPAWSGRPSFFGYGGVLTEREIKQYLRSAEHEAAVYQAIYQDKSYPSLIKTKGTHGTSVMQLLAGEYVPFPQNPVTAPHDAAAGADVMFVQLPNDSLDDTSSSALSVCALDAIRYILDRAETYRPLERPQRAATRSMRKVVINLSYGVMSGPHDGTGLLDRAIDEIVRERGDVAVVVAAGNSRKSRCHASLAIAAGGQGQVGLAVAPANPLPTTVEIWLPESNRGIAVGLTDADGNASGWVERGQVHALRRGGCDVAWLVYPKTASLGGSGRLALLAVAPTLPDPQDGQKAPHGLWTISVRNRSTKDAEVDVWADRNDMAYARHRRQQAHLQDIDGPAVTTAGTMCSPASASCAVAVGARVWSTGGSSEYSSEGYRRGKAKTDADAPVDLGGRIRGIRVPACATGATVRLSGTSAAAPIVARQLANWMAPRAQANTWGDIQAFLASLAPKSPVD